MKPVRSIVVILLVTTLALAAENRFQPATVLSIEKKTTMRVLYYVVNTPITRDDPYYDISVQLRDVVYAGRYTPRHKDDELPDDWKTGATVQARIQGHHLFLKFDAGPEVEFVMTKKKPALAEQSHPTATHNE